MKFYDFSMAPSPRKVRMYIHEKGLEIPTEQVDLRSKEQFSDAFRAINPNCTVPVLALDDGRIICESEAICRYLEELHPTPALFGSDAWEKAQVSEWLSRIELNGYLAVAEAFRNQGSFYQDRAIPGPEPIEQIPQLVERGKKRVGHFYQDLNKKLETRAHEWLAGDNFSMADIVAYIVVDFSKRLEMQPEPGLKALHEWYQRMASRPSAQC